MNQKKQKERYIVHIDGDGFFAGCEVAKDPTLKGRPVVVGADRGIALALTYEAKALGIKRGMQIHMIKKYFPEAIILPSDFHTYARISKTMFDIVSQYSNEVEHYSIDECFASLSVTEEERAIREATLLKEQLNTSLGMTFSLGIAKTKVLAKIASSYNKPNGFMFLGGNALNILERVPIGDIWGIGRKTSVRMRAKQIMTAKDLADQTKEFISTFFPLPIIQIWHELHETPLLELHTKPTALQSLLRTRTFTPTANPRTVKSELIHNIEVACMRLRQQQLTTRRFSFFLKTNDFHYHAKEITLHIATDDARVIVNEVERHWGTLYTPAIYRATGIRCSLLSSSKARQLDLFAPSEERGMGPEGLTHIIDLVNRKYRSPVIHLLSSNQHLHPQPPDQHQIGKLTVLGEIN